MNTIQRQWKGRRKACITALCLLSFSGGVLGGGVSLAAAPTTASALAASNAASTALPDLTPTQQQQLRASDSGTQLSMTRQYIEQQRLAKELAKDRNTGTISGVDTSTDKQVKDQVTFILQEVDVPDSKVLTKDEIQAVTKPYIGKQATVDTLYKIVEDINALYQSKGYITCKAYLAPQRISGGKVVISLVEGVNGTVEVMGNRYTDKDYVLKRIRLPKGEVPNLNDMNKDMLRFNATNDAQVRLALKAGAEAGTTDYELTVYEPQQYVFGLIADNMGSQTSGVYRKGVYWMDRSLTGARDNFLITGVTTQGTKSFSTSYSRPIDTSGTTLNLNYSANTTKIVNGDLKPLDVRGHGSAYSIGFTKPLVTTENMKSDIGVSFSQQHSITNFMHDQLWVDDTTKGIDFFYDQTNYSPGSVIYQRHAYRWGTANRLNPVAEGYETRKFGKYTGNFIYQHAMQAGQLFTAKADLQLASTQYLTPSEQFYIGGMYSVRGYKESLLSGDSGMYVGVEYSWTMNTRRDLNGFIFFDSGRVWGDSAFDDHQLASTGFGFKANIDSHNYLSVAVGLPLIRDINGTEQSRTRVHFTYSGQF